MPTSAFTNALATGGRDAATVADGSSMFVLSASKKQIRYGMNAGE